MSHNHSVKRIKCMGYDFNSRLCILTREHTRKSRYRSDSDDGNDSNDDEELNKGESMGVYFHNSKN